MTRSCNRLNPVAIGKTVRDIVFGARRTEHWLVVLHRTGTVITSNVILPWATSYLREYAMCDEHTIKDTEEYSRKQGLTRREFSKGSAGVVLSIMLPSVRGR